MASGSDGSGEMWVCVGKGFPASPQCVEIGREILVVADTNMFDHVRRKRFGTTADVTNKQDQSAREPFSS